MKPKTRQKVLVKARSLFNRRGRPSSRAPGEHLTIGSAAASASSPSGVYLEPSTISPKQRSSFSSTTPSQYSSVVPSAVDAPKANSEPSDAPLVSQIPACHSTSSINPLFDLSSDSLIAPKLQSIQCSRDPPPSMSLVATSPEAQRLTLALLSDLWSRAINEAKGEVEILKWLQKHQIHQENPKDPQSQTSQTSHIGELMSCIEANKLPEQSDKTLKIPLRNREITARDYVANAVAFITKVGDIAFSCTPMESSAPWAITKAVLQVPVHRIEQQAALLGTVKWFTSIVRRGQIYEALYTIETTDKKAIQGLHDGLLQVYIAAIKMLARSDALFNSGAARQTLTSIIEPNYASDTIKTLFEKEKKLDREIYACEVSRSALSFSLTNTQMKGLEKQLYQLSSPLPQIEKGVDAVLCLKGTIGTGKTYLTSKAIDHIKQTIESTPQHNEGFAFFYCNRSGPSMQDPLIILRSFVRQLAGKAFDKSGVIQNSLVQTCDAVDREKREFTLEDCEHLLLDSFNLYSRTTIVLDALDETDIADYNLGAILTTLMQKSENSVKVFISSRPDREYLEAFTDETIITVDASNQQEDIEKFLAEKLYTTKFFQQRSQAVQNIITNVFTARSCGMFRWVYLQVTSLKGLITDKAICNWACNFPVDLMAAYDQLWEKIIREHDKLDVDLAKRAIILVLCSFEPLHIYALPEAIRYEMQGSVFIQNEKQTQQQILSLCQDLLTIDEERRVWMLPHASVAEYFEKTGWVSIWECDAFASKLCLHLLNGPLRSEGGWSGNFASYAEKYWHKHVGRYDKWLGSNEQKADPDLAAALKRFLGSPVESSANFRKWAKDTYKGVFFETITAMCKYGLYYTLRDWWEQPGEITAEAARRSGFNSNNTVIFTARSRCMPICRRMMDLMSLKEDRYTHALERLIEDNEFDTMKFLVAEASLDVNLARRENRRGHNTAAQMAARRRPSILQWLVDQDLMDLERENESGHEHGNVLIAAAAWGNLESVRILLKAGANANAAVHNGKYGSALVAAVTLDRALGKRVEVVRLLLSHGADPNMPMRAGKYGSPLEAALAHDWAAQEDCRRIQHLLLEAGADPTAVSEYGEYGSALAAAAFWGRKEDLGAMIGKIGTERAIEALGQSRHPDERRFREQQDVTRWKETITYLAEEVGVGEEVLYAIGLWDVEPEPNYLPSGWQDGFILRYSKYH